MGDRCSCRLQLKEPASPELLALLEDADEADDTIRWFSFDEVNYARIEDDLSDYLVENQIPAAWYNGAGGGYGEGVMIFRGGVISEWPTLNGEIVVSVKNLEWLEASVDAQAFLEDLEK